MEQEGWVRAEWGRTDKNREARFYSLTGKGRKQLIQEEERWTRLHRVSKECKPTPLVATLTDLLEPKEKEVAEQRGH
jgi:DNA-binding PadR family transcriptional regulator